MTNTEITAAKLATIDAAAADRGLSHLGFRLLWLMASAADRSTGVIRRKQTDLAQLLGVSARAVRYALDHLVILGYLETVGRMPGKYISGYKVVMSGKRTPTSAFEKAEANFRSDGDKNVSGCNAVSPEKRKPVSAFSKAEIQRQKAEIQRQNEEQPFLQSPLISLDLPGARTREPRCPDGLGPLGDALRKRIEPAKFEAWLGKGEAAVVGQTDKLVTIAVRSRFFAEQIRNRFESDILDCLPGVVGIRFEVKEAATAAKAAP